MTTAMNLKIDLNDAFDLQSVAIMLGMCPTCFGLSAVSGCGVYANSYFLVNPHDVASGVIVDISKLRDVCGPRSFECRDDFDFSVLTNGIDSGLTEIDMLHWQHVDDSSYGVVADIFGYRVIVDDPHVAYACMERRKKFYYLLATHEELASCSVFDSVESLFDAQNRDFNVDRFVRNLESLGVRIS